MMKDMIEILMPIIALLITALSGVATAALTQWFQKLGMDKEALDRVALQSALTNAAYLALARGFGVKTGVLTTVPDEVINYVLKSTPDAVRRFGLTATDIADMIIPKIVAAQQGDTSPPSRA